MSPREKELREKIREYIKQAPQELDEGGVTGWVIDKIANGFKWATNRKADYQYDAMIRSSKFKSLAKNYKMSTSEWEKVARKWIKKDPQKFARILSGKMSGPAAKHIRKI